MWNAHYIPTYLHIISQVASLTVIMNDSCLLLQKPCSWWWIASHGILMLLPFQPCDKEELEVARSGVPLLASCVVLNVPCIWALVYNLIDFNCYVQDGIGEFFADADTKLYWVSFLDGMQRILLFTDDIAVATVAQQVKCTCPAVS